MQADRKQRGWRGTGYGGVGGGREVEGGEEVVTGGRGRTGRVTEAGDRWGRRGIGEGGGGRRGTGEGGEEQVREERQR